MDLIYKYFNQKAAYWWQFPCYNTERLTVDHVLELLQAEIFPNIKGSETDTLSKFEDIYCESLLCAVALSYTKEGYQTKKYHREPNWLWQALSNFFFCFRFPSSLGELFVSTTNFKMNMNFLQFIWIRYMYTGFIYRVICRTRLVRRSDKVMKN